ncbi:Hypothetical predicted protein [Mytilus galloprovincialis]|uniref:Uncharacterized protein n=1 Tax=Mytilus galloprovincialis TaxID=29158 RepID=A0A8B6DW66_MYTGA|nr:Hypothetical predicted protein [Mytilus galloprovincialis]
MWTRFIDSAGPFIPNHFVTLVSIEPDVEPEVVTVADYADVEPESDIDAEPVADIIDADLAFDMNSTTQSDNLKINPLSNGCLQKSFIETTEVIDLLSTFSEAESHDAIPQGTKNDVFFMIRNGNNIINRSNGKKSEFLDDCGVWDKNKGSNRNNTTNKHQTDYDSFLRKEELTAW